MMRLAGLLILASLAFGCSVITPPPLMPRHMGAAADPVGAVSATAIGGVAGGPWVNGSAGGEGRVMVQATPRLAVGAGIGGGSDVERRDAAGPHDLVAGRVFGRYGLDARGHFALDFGLGAGGMDNGLRYTTADLGFLASHTFAQRLTIYGGPTVALSMPVQAGDPVEDNNELRAQRTTFAYGLTAGVGVKVIPNLVFSLELLMLDARTQRDEAFIMSGTAGLRVTFGG
ncbi:MAG TPA: hypothetical protein VGQ83_34085 [Polyangia bacterium]|jgi:hypothetical protein